MIPPSQSLIFEVKSSGSELAFIRVLRLGLGNARAVSAFRRLQKTSDVFERLRTSSGIFGNDRVVFKNPSTPRIKISCLYLRKSWQVYFKLRVQLSALYNLLIYLVVSLFIYFIYLQGCCLVRKFFRSPLGS